MDAITALRTSLSELALSLRSSTNQPHPAWINTPPSITTSNPVSVIVNLVLKVGQCIAGFAFVRFSAVMCVLQTTGSSSDVMVKDVIASLIVCVQTLSITSATTADSSIGLSSTPATAVAVAASP